MIEFKDLPSKETPINAANLNKMQSDLQDLIDNNTNKITGVEASVEDLSITSERNIITAYLKTQYTIQTSSVFETIPLDASIKAGTKLSLEDGKIKIGKGITKALVSAKIQHVSAGTSTGGRNIAIRKNGEYAVRGMYKQTEAANSYYVLPPVLIDVQENDLIELTYYGEKGNKVEADKVYSNLTVEGIA